MSLHFSIVLVIEDDHDDHDDHDTDHDDHDRDHVTDLDDHDYHQQDNTTHICNNTYHLLRDVILAVELTTEDCLEGHDHHGNSSDTSTDPAEGECTYLARMQSNSEILVKKSTINLAKYS